MGGAHVDSKHSEGQDLKVATQSPTEVPRSSFSSVRENYDGFAQTFTRTDLSSYSQAPVFDESPSPTFDSQPFFQQPLLTQPASRLHGNFYSDADSFKGWREIPLKGKKASRSCENLVKLWESASQFPVQEAAGVPTAIGLSALESLPNEILRPILRHLLLDIPPNGITTRNTDLMALLVTSRRMHETTTSILYQNITIPHSRIFRKFLTTIQNDPTRASLVRRLDFSHFNPSTMFRTAGERAKAKNLTAESLKECLDLMPYLQEFLAQEYVDEDLSTEVLQKLFFDLPQLRAIDFCGCSTKVFKDSILDLLKLQWPDELPMRRVSLHKCLSLPSAFFETILPRLTKLTHLDVAGTHITDAALLSIPHSAKITHLNLANCFNLSSSAVTEFITTHPAVTGSLQWLSLATSSQKEAVVGSDDVGTLLSGLPSSLVALHLKGSPMNASHIPRLATLTQTLEELSLGFGLTISEVSRLFRAGDSTWLRHNLRYLCVTDIGASVSTGSDIFSSMTHPLQVVEVEEKDYKRIDKLKQNPGGTRDGWATKSSGSRFWVVRSIADAKDDGWRSWKMGAESWGMRKIPVAVADVGGMYGSFMFSRDL